MTSGPIVVQVLEGETIDFGFELEIAGSRSLQVTPLGRSTTLDLTGSWPHPSFSGAYLPASRQIGPDDLEANWTVSHLGRKYPQSWTSLDEHSATFATALPASRFGVSLIQECFAILKRDCPVAWKGMVQVGQAVDCLLWLTSLAVQIGHL